MTIANDEIAYKLPLEIEPIEAKTEESLSANNGSGASGFLTTTIYEVTGEIKLVPTSKAVAGPRQGTWTSKQHEPAKNPKKDKSLVPL